MKKLIACIILFFILFQTLFAQSAKNPAINDVLTLKVNGNNYQDNAYIIFNNNATLCYDSQYDVKKLFGLYAAPQFYSIVCDSVLLSINSLPFPIGNYSIQLGLNIGKDTVYTITASGVADFTNNPVILLEDTKLLTFINLLQQPVYIFSALTSDSVKRFKVHFTSSTDIADVKKAEISIYADKGKIFIQNKGIEIIQSIEVFDISGRLIKRINSDKNFIILDMEKSANICIIRILTNKSIYSKKLQCFEI